MKKSSLGRDFYTLSNLFCRVIEMSGKKVITPRKRLELARIGLNGALLINKIVKQIKWE